MSQNTRKSIWAVKNLQVLCFVAVGWETKQDCLSLLISAGRNPQYCQSTRATERTRTANSQIALWGLLERGAPPHPSDSSG